MATREFIDEWLRIIKWLGLVAFGVVLSLAVAGGVWMGGKLLSEQCPCGAECHCRKGGKSCIQTSGATSTSTPASSSE